MTEASSPTKRFFGGLLAVTGGLMAVLAGLCALVYAGAIVHDGLRGRLGGGPLSDDIEQWLLVDLVVGGIPTLLGVGLLALGLRFRNREPGRPPAWHLIIGGLLILLGLTAAGLFVWQVILAFDRTPAAPDASTSGIVIQVVVGAVAPTLIAALMMWIGCTLMRPRK